MELAQERSGRTIHISIETTEPLRGTAAGDETGRRLEFDGWMGLIGAVAELLGTTQDVREAR